MAVRGQLVLVALLACARGAVAEERTGLEFFEKQVRPILAARCHQCHGPEKQESNLRLDSAPTALAGGVYGPAVVPGKPDESMLVYATSYKNEDLQMPPKGRLPDAEVAILRHWVEMGAPWPEQDVANGSKPFNLAERKANHWAWQPVRRPEVPVVHDSTWPHSEIDNFVVKRLEDSGLKPAADADRRTLIRRVYLDLIGMPPTPDELADFLADDSPDAFERVVDHLLSSPQFGERWARHWFDLVRYAETYGHEQDFAIPHAWQYRDYVIRALNADVPYNEFVTEHVAGDLIKPPRVHPIDGFNESIIATGFWFMYEQTHAPTDIRQHEADRVDNQIDVMTKAFLGITVGCARCHDHKFDAISTRDYYALAGFLKSSRQQIALLDPHDTIEATAQRLNELRAAGTQLLHEIIPAPTDASGQEFARCLLAAREVENGRSINDVAGAFDLNSEELLKWVAALQCKETAQRSHPLYAWVQLKNSLAESPLPAGELAKKIREDATARNAHGAQKWLMKRDGGTPCSDWFLTGWAFTDCAGETAAWDAASEAPGIAIPGTLESGTLANNLQGAARSPTFTIPGGQVHVRAKGQGQIRLVVDNYMLDDVLKLLFDGLIQECDTGGEWKWITIKGDLKKYIGERGYLSVEDDGTGALAVNEIVFADSPPPDPPSALVLSDLERGEVDTVKSLAAAYGRAWEETLTQWHSNRLDAAHAELLNWALRANLIDTASIAARLADLRSVMGEANEALPGPMMVLAIADGTGQDEHVYLRGKHQNLGDVVPRRFLEAICGADQPPIGSGSGRLELARRITDPANPLFARTAVNRVWHHLFGRGIAPTVDNLGMQGELPTHPELLDWLAEEFVNQGWSQKKLIRMLILSRTYQMSSRPVDAAAEQLDPANLLFHRANVRRLEGEAIRDSMLAVSGRLNRTMFGPSVPAHLSPYAESRFQPKTSGPLDGDGRRTVYLEVRRNYLPPMLLVFDTPTPFTSIGRRNLSNVPAQALTMLNDPLVVDLARQWAQQVLNEDADQSPRWRIEQMYESALCRLPTEVELRAAEGFIERQGELLGLPAADRNADLRIWSDLAHVLFNHKEFVLRN
jgi:mono/diheme cytochrome c family protein